MLREIKFVDLCAGLGGFHQALKYFEARSTDLDGHKFRCVLAAELDPELRELYVANFKGLSESYASEFSHSKWIKHRDKVSQEIGALSAELDLYDHEGRIVRIHGDLNALIDGESKRLRRWPDGTTMVPEHDMLCAGFPCQPFSKSGAQRGFEDVDGTVFNLIAVVLQERRPGIVLLENVGNFERHDTGNTWLRVKEILLDLGYEVKATTHVGGSDGGTGLLSPHHVGLPHHRERFFISARQPTERRVQSLVSATPFPRPVRWSRTANPEAVAVEERATETLSRILESSVQYSSKEEFAACQVSADRLRCIAHWQRLLDKISIYDKYADEKKKIQPMPSFPIWGFELDLWNQYPISSNPKNHLRTPRIFNNWRKKGPRKQIQKLKLSRFAPTGTRTYLKKASLSREEIQEFQKLMPSYAINRDAWPKWKQTFISQNRTWALKLWENLDSLWLREWLDALYQMPPSHQKLEWNCQGETLDLWSTILQFRPSGLRAKRFAHVPALVAMTTTQVPLVPKLVVEPGPQNGPGSRIRHLLAIEALQLQGFPVGWKCPNSRERTFQALGNAVNAELVAQIFLNWFEPLSTQESPNIKTDTSKHFTMREVSECA